MGEVEKDILTALPGKGGLKKLLRVPAPRGFDEGFYNSGSRAGSLKRLVGVQGLLAFNSVSGGPVLILMSSSGPFNLASGGFLAAPPLISNC